MKKYLLPILAVIICFTVFAACSKNADDSTTDADGKITTITTEPAAIIGDHAIKLIKSYSAEELSLTEEEFKECQFMVRKSGNEIHGDYYIQVIATVPTEHKKEGDDNTYYSFDNKGEYYIRYDGKQILKKNMDEEDSYEELEVKELPTSADDSAHEASSDTTE